MGEESERIDDALRAWIGKQRMYFVGTAPLTGTGHINLSPKAPMVSFRVLGDKTVAY